MVEISNNILAGLLLVAVVLSAIGLLSLLSVPIMQLTGAATSGQGLANVTVQSSYSVRMIRNVSNFGSGTIIEGNIRHLYTNSTNAGGFYNGSEGNGSADDYGTGTHVYPFVVQNDGNDDTTCIQVSGTAAATFIGSATAVFEAAAKDNITGSCTAGLVTAWTTVDGSADTMCQQLDKDQDELRIHWHIGIPDDAPPAEKTNTITVTALNSC